MSFSEKDVLDILREMDLQDTEINSIDVTQKLSSQGIDSLDMMDLYFRIEENIGKKIEFDDEKNQQEQWGTVAGIVKGVNSL